MINISAEASAKYRFNKWTSSGGGTFGDADRAGTTFTMPAEAVTITANFTYKGGGSGSGGSSYHSESSKSTDTYKAVLSGIGNGDRILAVSISDNGSHAAVDIAGIFAEMAARDKTPLVTIPDIPGVNTHTVKIPVASLTGTQKSRLTISTELERMTISANMLAGKPEAEGTTAITISEGDKANLPDEIKKVIGDRPLVQLALTIEGEKREWNNPNAPITVSIPYTPIGEELAHPEHITIWYIDGEGHRVDMPSGRYDARTGMVTFSTTHFSGYGVVFVKKIFDDLDKVAWAKEQIEILASKGILKGITTKVYAPRANITRADFLYSLVRTLDIQSESGENFADIAKNAYYYDEIAIAKKMGITHGTGKNRFNPDGIITRQDMMVLTEGTLRRLGKIEAKGTAADLDRFDDRSLIAAYAADSIASCVKEGLITGSGAKINPLGNTTRAEAAVFLYSIYNRF